MSDHSSHASDAPQTVERRCDVAVIGGSAAGLAAALQLARQRRSVIVVDAGDPRNAPAAHMHSYLGHEGIAPPAFAGIARDEVRSYGVEVLPGRALAVARENVAGSAGSFRVELAGGNTVVARRVLVATGIVDELPDIPGLAEQWGSGVIHCPFCHGYEVRDQRIVQIVTHPMGLHPSALFRQLTERLTLVLHEGVAADNAELDALRAGGVRVVDGPVGRIVTADGRVTSVELVSGERIDADAVAVGARFRPRVEALASLGVTTVPHQSGLGQVLEAAPNGETSVPGLFAAGNVTDPGQQVLAAAANGSWVGGMISFSLAGDDLTAAARPSSGRADWDQRFSGEPLWSGNPNATLVAEADGLAPGRALDVGAGEGGDAVWLASHGWEVTASDISQRALDRVASAARERDLTIACVRVDANDRDAFGPQTFELVTAHYAAIPRTPDRRAVENVLAAVAPGGTLLYVGHDLEPMREHIDIDEHSRPFDPDAYVRIDDVVAVLAASPDWVIDVHEMRPRGPEHSASHHVDDVVLRARRTR